MQGFLSALNYYSRSIQNMVVYGAVLYQLKDADFADGGDLAAAKSSFAELKTKVANAPILRHFDSAKEVHIMLFANAWALKRSQLSPSEKEVLALLHILKVGHTLFAGKTLHVYTRFSTLEWVFTSKPPYGRAVSFAVLLSPYHLKVKRIRELDADFTQLLQATVTPHIGLDESLSHLAPPSKNSATVRIDPELLYAHIPQDFAGHVLSFDGSAKTEKNGGYGSCSWILWSLPSWDIVIAASAHLQSTTVNIAEYTGMNDGVMAALERGLTDLIIVGDSRLVIQQSMGAMAGKKEALQLELARHKKLTDQLSSVRYLHLLRHYNAAADSLATEALEIHFEDEANKNSAGISQNTGLHDKDANQPNSRAEGLQFESPRAPKRVRRVEDQAEVEVSEGRIPDATDIEAERRKHIPKVQVEELRWADLKALLWGELDSLTHRRAHNASKIADSFVLSEDGLVYYQGQRRRRAELDSADISLRLVVPTTMVDEVLHSCDNSIEGGHQGIVRTFHRVKAEFYWVGLYADVSKHVQTCEDCSTSKSKPQLRGYSPGNGTSEYLFQMVSMDSVIPLPVTRRVNTALLLCQDHFTRFVIAKAMSETGALEVAKAFEECVLRRFGAPSLIRHDQDPRFMSEVFQAFAELMQSRSRATLSYRPQANDQQERSVKTMIQTGRAYVEDPLQADWYDIAEKMVHAINNSRDMTRRETPLYLVDSWDAQSTLKSMTSTIKKDPANSADAAQWRREANHQREIAL
ncbi:unnamed protein product [Phytophthora fragariaefolia]|uniref:Unnamed protein product n=1 Tax=Phytophthora fragariaefolia TaxID=1490495 RepID=A0A9W6XR79_9STRA|nr:unnamed protein product [Phytophthora fragariaefolia]